MERNAIIQKIRKLMELQLSAENVGQSGEAFAAANAIHKLLTKYNLSLDEITSGEDDEKDGLYISPKMQAHDEYGNWRDILMVKLADRELLSKFRKCKTAINHDGGRQERKCRDSHTALQSSF